MWYEFKLGYAMKTIGIIYKLHFVWVKKTHFKPSNFENKKCHFRWRKIEFGGNLCVRLELKFLHEALWYEFKFGYAMKTIGIIYKLHFVWMKKTHFKASNFEHERNHSKYEFWRKFACQFESSCNKLLRRLYLSSIGLF